MINVKLILAYDGSDYLGWQETKEGPSIESALKHALQTVLRHPVVLQAASRTDVGVHAQGQVVNFFTENPFDLRRLHNSLNGLLPRDIVVKEVELTTSEFHPTLDVKGKEYHYYVCYGPVQLPHRRRYCWHCPFLLDRAAMQKAALLLVGRHDFKAFCNAQKNSSYSDFVRCVQSLRIVDLEGEELRFEVVGDHFLYKMVRNIVGTLVYIGRGRLNVSDLPDILASGDRTRGGITAPAHGLKLEKVLYSI